MQGPQIAHSGPSAQLASPPCAKSGRFQHLHALIRGGQISLHNHAEAPKPSGAFFGVLNREKVPETARPRQKRAEGLSGGAAKKCYGKFGWLAGSREKERKLYSMYWLKRRRYPSGSCTRNSL